MMVSASSPCVGGGPEVTTSTPLHLNLPVPLTPGTTRCHSPLGTIIQNQNPLSLWPCVLLPHFKGMISDKYAGMTCFRHNKPQNPWPFGFVFLRPAEVVKKKSLVWTWRHTDTLHSSRWSRWVQTAAVNPTFLPPVLWAALSHHHTWNEQNHSYSI